MGSNECGIILDSRKNYPVEKFRKEIFKLGHIRPSPELATSVSCLKGSEYYIYDDNRLKAEFELSLPGDIYVMPSLSIRYAVCHPESADDIFLEIVFKLAKALKAKMHLRVNMPKGYPYVYRYSFLKKRTISEVFRSGVAEKRNCWMRQFGPETGCYTTSEADWHYYYNESYELTTTGEALANYEEHKKWLLERHVENEIKSSLRQGIRTEDIDWLQNHPADMKQFVIDYNPKPSLSDRIITLLTRAFCSPE